MCRSASPSRNIIVDETVQFKPVKADTLGSDGDFVDIRADLLPENRLTHTAVDMGFFEPEQAGLNFGCHSVEVLTFRIPLQELT